MLMYDPRTAAQFADLLLGQPDGTTTVLGDMEESALGEMGNIVGASLLSVLADGMDIDLRPSPPAVMTDMAGALLDIVAADLMMTEDSAFVAESTFRTRARQIDGTFFVMPSGGLLEALQAWEAAA
jgi:chemotaxis protein CheC